jgi:hypothetical protein
MQPLGKIMNNKIYHLQMIQGVINRLSSNSFLIKGWSITIVAAMIALLARGAEKRYILFSILPVVMFWFLDTVYLHNERRYTALFNEVRLLEENKIDFSMDVKKYGSSKSWIKALFSRTILIFYLIMIVTVIVIYIWL